MACPAGFLTIVLLQIVFLQLLFSHFFENQMLLRNPQGKLKVKRFLIDARNFLIRVDPLSFQFVCCINILYEHVRVVCVFYDVLYCLCCMHVKNIYVLYCRVVFLCFIFVVVFLCCIFVLYFCVVFLMLYFSCCIV